MQSTGRSAKVSTRCFLSHMPQLDCIVINSAEKFLWELFSAQFQAWFQIPEIIFDFLKHPGKKMWDSAVKACQKVLIKIAFKEH